MRVPPGTSALDEDLIVAGRNVELHRTLVGGPSPDLVVWGEGALDPGALADATTLTEVQGAVSALGARPRWAPW